MASSIPFDHPSLVLGHVVNTDLLRLLEKMGGVQLKTDAAFDKMNSFIAMRRGLSMTINELVGLGVDIGELKTRIADLNQKVSDAARDYMATRIANDTAVQQLREELSTIENAAGLQSPLDFKTATVKRLPLASDSLKMDVQYFSYGSNDDTSAVAISAIEGAIRDATTDMGSNARELSRTASAQISQQRKHHSIAGTLVIIASCSHRATAMLEPLVFDVDKTLDIWNHVHAAAGEALNPADLTAMRTAADTPAGKDDKSLTVLTGANYGSSFVGMVHMVNNEMAGTGLPARQQEALQEQMRLGSWIQGATGGFGVDEAVIDNVRRLLSTQSISTHANMIVLGAVPKIGSAQLQMGVAKLLEEQPRQMAAQADMTDDYAHSSLKTVHSSAESSVKGANVLAMQGGMMQNLIQGLGKIDQGANKVFDLNTLMNSFSNYLEEVSKEGAVGVPISFFFQKISRPKLARMWLEKYYASAQAPADKPS